MLPKGILISCFTVLLSLSNVATAQTSGFAPFSQETILYSFSGGNDGGVPYAGMASDPSGNLYGTTNQGGTAQFGTVFKLTQSQNGWQETVLYSFAGSPDGEAPGSGTLVIDRAGHIFGTTTGGGVYGFGTVFELIPGADNTWVEQVLYSFRGSVSSDGLSPWGSIVFDGAGNLYGATKLGGPATSTCPAGCGTVFELTPSGSGWTETVLYSFKGGTDGAGVYGGVILNKQGNSLFGTTSEGGTSGSHGTVFQLASNNGIWKEAPIYRFRGSRDGGNPYSGLVSDSAGNIYGTTFYGGTKGYGTVFELTHSQTGWKENVLHSFTAQKDGGFPYYGTLLVDKAGNLYGTTSVGGGMADGVAYELSLSGSGKWIETVLYSFSGEDGWEPDAGLTFDAAGNLYGTTSGGGGLGSCSDDLDGCGVAFKLTP